LAANSAGVRKSSTLWADAGLCLGAKRQSAYEPEPDSLNGYELTYQEPIVATAANNAVIVWRRLKSRVTVSAS